MARSPTNSATTSADEKRCVGGIHEIRPLELIAICSRRPVRYGAAASSKEIRSEVWDGEIGRGPGLGVGFGRLHARQRS